MEVHVTHNFSFFLLLISCCVYAYIGTYHQYDNVVYPKHIKTSKSLYTRAKETAKSVGAMFGFGSSSSFEMGKFCLQVYLERYKEMLHSSSFPKQANLQTIVEEVCHIFNLLYSPIVFYQAPSLHKLDGNFVEVCLFVFHFTNHCMVYSTFHYNQVMKEWLESVVDALQSEAAEKRTNQLASALCIAHCLSQLGIHNVKIEKFALPLVKMLYLKPDLKRKECPEYVSLCEILPIQHR